MQAAAAQDFRDPDPIQTLLVSHDLQTSMSSKTSNALLDAYAVLLPAIAGTDVEASFDGFLYNGGRAILLGETRDEYVARRMSSTRLASETPERIRQELTRARAKYGPLIVAVDQELGGIQRLEGLAPTLPTAASAASMSDEEIEDACLACARAARHLGVNMFLAPILDVVTGANPWLAGRTLGSDIDTVGRIGAAYVRGVQRGGVVAVAKHFPGYSDLAGDPALTDVSLHVTNDDLWHRAAPFRRSIAAGVLAVLAGPAPVIAVDEINAACVSPKMIRLLKEQFGFSGLVITDDIDAPATLRGRKLEEVAVSALAAGADLLLLSHGPHLPRLCEHIVSAVNNGLLSRERLAEAASRVRSLAAHHS
jgi:beta-N-acetylhexosaminidase